MGYSKRDLARISLGLCLTCESVAGKRRRCTRCSAKLAERERRRYSRRSLARRQRRMIASGRLSYVTLKESQAA